MSGYECDNDNHRIGCQCPGVVQYPGMINRQELVDWCRSQLPRITAHVETLEKARGLTSDPNKIVAFNEAISRLFGEQTALRNVCEWSKDHVARTPGDEGEGPLQRNVVS